MLLRVLFELVLKSGAKERLLAHIGVYDTVQKAVLLMHSAWAGVYFTILVAWTVLSA